MLIRGIRNLDRNYERNGVFVPDSEEIIRFAGAVNFSGTRCELMEENDDDSGGGFFESDVYDLYNDICDSCTHCGRSYQDNTLIDCSGGHKHKSKCRIPKEIILKVSLHPIAMDKVIKFSQTMRNRSLSIENIYNLEYISPNSEINGNFCKSIAIKYENEGSFEFEGKPKEFKGKKFENFQLDISEILFQENFEFEKTDIINEELTDSDSEERFYAYCGYYSDNIALKNVQQCIFKSNAQRNKLKISVMTAKSWLKNMEGHPEHPFTETAKSFSSDFYEKICNGACKLKVVQSSGKEETIFRSCSIEKNENSNIATIRFIKN